jgi:hypothetical protein
MSPIEDDNNSYVGPATFHVAMATPGYAGGL